MKAAVRTRATSKVVIIEKATIFKVLRIPTSSRSLWKATCLKILTTNMRAVTAVRKMDSDNIDDKEFGDEVKPFEHLDNDFEESGFLTE